MYHILMQRVPFLGAKVANQVKISIKITCEITLRFTCDFFLLNCLYCLF